MPSITFEQIRKINGKTGNGFTLDVEHYVTWGDKQFIKDIALDEKHVLRAEITFATEFENLPNYRRREWHVPVIWLQYFTKLDGGMMGGVGFGYKEPLGERMERKMSAVLQKHTHAVSDEKIMEVYARWNNPMAKK